MSTKILALASAAAVCLSASARFTYTNGFANRASSRAPEFEERSLDYHLGDLYYNYSASSPTMETPYSEPSHIQDNWIKMSSTSGLGSRNPFFTAMTNSAGGAVGAFYKVMSSTPAYLDDSYACYAVHPFGSSLSNGTIRLTFDTRNPSEWPRIYGWTRVGMARRSTFDALPDTAPSPLLFQTGLAMRNTVGHPGHPVFNDRGSYYTSISLVPLNWYRFTVEVELETGACSYRVDDLGAGNPTFETEPVASILSKTTTLDAEDLPTPEDPLAALTIHVGRIPCDTNETNGAISDRTIAYDNLRLEWKAPGAAAFGTVYENDFSTRVLQPVAMAGTAADYAATTPSDPRAYSGYTVCAYDEFPGACLMPYYTNTAAQTSQATANAAYVDEWKRICTYTYGEPVVVASPEPNAGGNVLRLATSKSDRYYVNAVQTLNETVTTGKVRVEADIRAPATWGWNSYVNKLVVGLGNAKCYSANSRSGFASSATQFNAGISSSGKKASATYKNTFTPYGSPEGSDDAFRLTKSHWYRMILTGDLDGRTFGYALYDLGTSGVAADYPTPEEATFSTNSVPIGDITEVSSLVITCWGLGKTWDNAALVDNIRVYRDAGTEDETLIYSNDFDTRVRYNASVTTAAPTGPLGGTVDKCGAFDGQDLWTIAEASGTSPKAEIRGGTNPCAMLSSDGEVKVEQTFAKMQETGGFSFSADLRAPTIWRTDTAEREPRMAFSAGTASAAAIRFGLCPTEGPAVDQDFIRRTVGLFAEDGGVRTYPAASVTAGHWYRFRGTGDLASGTWSLSVYDMGETQPTDTTPVAGAPVCTLSDLALGTPAGVALTKVSLEAAGAVKGELAYRSEEDPHVALFDNVVFGQDRSGVLVILK